MCHVIQRCVRASISERSQRHTWRRYLSKWHSIVIYYLNCVLNGQRLRRPYKFRSEISFKSIGQTPWRGNKIDGGGSGRCYFALSLIDVFIALIDRNESFHSHFWLFYNYYVVVFEFVSVGCHFGLIFSLVETPWPFLGNNNNWTFSYIDDDRYFHLMYYCSSPLECHSIDDPTCTAPPVLIE